MKFLIALLIPVALIAQTGASQITTKQTGTGAVLRNTQSKANDIISVKDFGVTGDGTTDDTANLQRAINTVCGTGSGLYWPNGTYRNTGTLSWAGTNCTWKGQSLSATQIFCDPTNAGTKCVSFDGGTGGGYQSENRIQDLQIYNTLPNSKVTNLLFVRAQNRFSTSNIHLSGGTNPLYLDYLQVNDYENTRVTNGTGTGVVWNPSPVGVSTTTRFHGGKCYIGSNGGDGISADSTVSTVFDGCTVESNAGRVMNVGHTIVASVAFINGHTEGNGSTTGLNPFRVGDVGSSISFSYLTLTNNQILASAPVATQESPTVLVMAGYANVRIDSIYALWNPNVFPDGLMSTTANTGEVILTGNPVGEFALNAFPFMASTTKLYGYGPFFNQRASSFATKNTRDTCGSGTLTPDFKNSPTGYTMVLAGAGCTIGAPTGMLDGQEYMMVVDNASGAGATVTFNAAWKLATGTATKTLANGEKRGFRFWYDPTGSRMIEIASSTSLCFDESTRRIGILAYGSCSPGAAVDINNGEVNPVIKLTANGGTAALVMIGGHIWEFDSASAGGGNSLCIYDDTVSAGTPRMCITNAGGIRSYQGYQASDGSAGVTAGACSSFKNGLCIAP